MNEDERCNGKSDALENREGERDTKNGGMGLKGEKNENPLLSFYSRSFLFFFASKTKTQKKAQPSKDRESININVVLSAPLLCLRVFVALRVCVWPCSFVDREMGLLSSSHP